MRCSIKSLWSCLKKSPSESRCVLCAWGLAFFVLGMWAFRTQALEAILLQNVLFFSFFLLMWSVRQDALQPSVRGPKNNEQLKVMVSQSERLASVGRLSAGIVHEIKNPLNLIINFSELNQELIQEWQDLAAQTQENTSAHAGQDAWANLQDIAQNVAANQKAVLNHGKRAQSIIENVLKYAKERGALVKEATDLNQLLEECFALAYHAERSKDPAFNVSLSKTLDHELPVCRVVKQDMGRVFINLLSNAMEALKGCDTPSLSLETGQEGDHVVVRVKDNGTGIQSSDLEKIFEPFFTTKPAHLGTGLGLSIVKDIVKHHKGQVQVQSVPYESTVFTVWLPKSEVLLQAAS